jgi:tRNA A-37 threonylcarbamoyl transferase component Bud32
MTPAQAAPKPSSDPTGAAAETGALPHQRTSSPVDLASLDPGEQARIAAGTSTDVFAVDDSLLLRRYRDGRDTADEARVLRYVRSLGFPAPAVVEASGPNLLLERLHGPTLLQALAADEVTIAEGARVLVDLHDRLHALPAPEGAAEGEVLVHLDIHPANVVLTEANGPHLIDWATARPGRAALDVAVTAVIIAEVAVDAGGTYSRAARAMLVAFLAAVQEDVVGALDEAVQQRLVDPALVTGERELVVPAAALVRQLVELAEPA